MADSIRSNLTILMLALVTPACVDSPTSDEDLPDPAGLEDLQEGATEGAPGAALADLPFAFQECGGTPNDSSSTYADDTSPAAVYSFPWKAETPGLGLYLGTQHITNIGGHKVSHTFNTPGTWESTLSYGYRQMRNAGKAAIYWDGQYFGTISLYAPDNVYRCEFTFYNMPSGVHTLMVKALNQKEAASGGTYVNLDYFRKYDF